MLAPFPFADPLLRCVSTDKLRLRVDQGRAENELPEDGSNGEFLYRRDHEVHVPSQRSRPKHPALGLCVQHGRPPTAYPKEWLSVPRYAYTGTVVLLKKSGSFVFNTSTSFNLSLTFLESKLIHAWMLFCVYFVSVSMQIAIAK